MALGSSRGFVLLVKQHQRSVWGRSPTKGEGVEKAEVTGGAAGGDGSNGVVARVARHGVALGVEPPGRLRVATGMGSMVA